MHSMGRKKKDDASKKDYHKYPIWSLRLPTAYRLQIEALAAQTRRTPTEEVKIAIEKYLESQGLWPPGGQNGDSP